MPPAEADLTLAIRVVVDDDQGGMSSETFTLRVSDWVRCGSEGTICSVPATATVRYGANDTYAYVYNVASSIDCDNSVFGDPIFGVYKFCEYQLTSINNTAPIVNVPIVDQLAAVNSVFVFEFSADTFIDDDNDVLTFSAT